MLICVFPKFAVVRIWCSAQGVLIFALPSESEGLGIVVMEAMAAGKPVVATRVGGLPSLVEHGRTGYLFDLNDYEGFAACLRRLCVAPELRRAMGAAGRQRAEADFRTETQVEEVVRMYEEVLRRCRR